VQRAILLLQIRLTCWNTTMFDHRTLIVLFFVAEDTEKSLLWEVHPANLFHFTFPFLLVFKMLHLALIMATVQTRRNICPHGFQGFTSDDLLPNCSLNGYFEKLSRDYRSFLTHCRPTASCCERCTIKARASTGLPFSKNVIFARSLFLYPASS